jgi:hypothetical protein
VDTRRNQLKEPQQRYFMLSLAAGSLPLAKVTTVVP